MSFDEALADATARPRDRQALEQLASQALECGEEESALPLLDAAIRARPSARLLQWKALLERALDRHEDALRSFGTAVALAPADPVIARGHARTALEAGVPAEHLYEQALRLAPHDGQVLAGLVAARFAAGNGEQAERELAAILARHPDWIDGHMQLAQLRSMLGKIASIAQSFESALAAAPRDERLWLALFDLHIKREDFHGLDTAIARAGKHGIGEQLLVPFAAVAAGELGRTDEADRLFARWTDGAERIWRIRHLLRSGRAQDALPLIDSELSGARANEAWPYAALAWRLTGDRRSDWLERGGELIRVYDLASSLPPLDRLADSLRAIHVAKGEYLDQSVRGGTQTDGPLFSRIDPENPRAPRRGRRCGTYLCLEPATGRARTSPARPEARSPHPLCRQLVGSASRRRLPYQSRSPARLDQLGALHRAARGDRRRRPSCRLAFVGRPAVDACSNSARRAACRAETRPTRAFPLLDVAWYGPVRAR